jgi:hypothetical protein
MTLVTTEDRGAVRVITYANSSFGTMTGAGSNEMLDSVAAGECIRQYSEQMTTRKRRTKLDKKEPEQVEAYRAKASAHDGQSAHRSGG